MHPVYIISLNPHGHHAEEDLLSFSCAHEFKSQTVLKPAEETDKQTGIDGPVLSMCSRRKHREGL